ncbi:aminoacyl-histidine dipeptidase [Dechloromonas sp. XY25]|uniref:Aminoacyl-histidine dipeptidase n=1 Tax=Dechloromonas hankyongensis TaxID=2908002 RepID=A0ABS9K3Y4_9RHOO|nr:aminoacyl-histidine dipeptidase [Dechloromonas hankyongensis]MCG2577894.1 aminoacyl-histidine dipeptidase [Dechloromonas hankyongensis]
MPQSSTAHPVFSGLQPAAVWAHFATLCRIPRASKHEAALRDELLAWAGGRGLAAEVDAAGNLLIRKPTTAGREQSPGVVLQAHLDMVCQKNGDSKHDFLRDPIVPTRDGGWLVADKTTLGADNGIGVALILAVLDSEDIAHGPLEALLTVDEEAGMGGARGLAPGVLHGRLMLNLDTEDWGEFYLGCAGGLDVNVERPGRLGTVPDGHQGWQIALHGLRGGHSGVEIHEERGNAIKLLVRVLHQLEQDFPLRLAALKGGTARNALPREAVASFVLPAGMGERLAAEVAELQALLRSELQGVDDGVALAVSPDAVSAVLAREEQAVWLATLQAAPHGVRRMSRHVPGVVETSNNLGMVDLLPASGSCNFMVRSLLDSGSTALADEIVSLWALSGTAASTEGYYPGWAPNPASALLKTCQAVYKSEFGADSAVQVIHAGLECGIIGAKYPGLDIVSFGPTIRGAHAPGERVDIASVARCWQLLTAILAELR